MSIEGTYVELSNVIEEFANVCDNAGPDDLFNHFSCTEIEALAKVFDTAGFGDTAENVRNWHAVADDIGDDHYDRKGGLE